MGLISVEGMRFFAKHGVYDEEQLVGNNFVVDVHIETAFDDAAREDDIHQTINYETVFLICQAALKKETDLIETLLFRIINGLKKQFNTIQEVKVRVCKLNPLPGEQMDKACVQMEDSFVNGCPRCESPFICYNDDNCWCQSIQLHPGMQKNLREKYRGCLCDSCLAFYAD